MRNPLIAAVTAAVLFVAVGCSNNTNAAAAQPSAVPAVTSTAVPTTIPVATPTPTSTAVSSPPPVTATAEPLSPSPTPTEIPPTEPDPWLERMGFDRPNGTAAVVVVDGRYGVWTSDDNGGSWTLHQVPGASGVTCSVRTSSRIATISDPWSDTPALLVFDLATNEWTEHPPPHSALGSSMRGPCQGIEVDGRLVWATHHDGALWFFVEESSGYRAMEIDFRVEEFPSTQPGYVGDLLYESSADRLVVATENFEGDCTPLTNLHSFPLSILDGVGATAWEDSAVERLNTEPLVSDQRVVDIDGELWTMEMVELYAFFKFEAGCRSVGRWAAGPLGSEPVPFPRGFTPKLYSVNGTVVAEVPLVDLSTIPKETIWTNIYADWFEFDRDARSWAQIDPPSRSYNAVERPFVSTLSDSRQAIAD